MANEEMRVDLEKELGTTDGGRSGKMPRVENPPGLAFPAQSPNPSTSSAATMEDLMRAIQRNGQEGETRHREIRMGKLEKEAREVKTTAARALTQPRELGQDMRHLRDRVTKSEIHGVSDGSDTGSVGSLDQF